ncbi:MAG TPA: VCBS repeat-containing protein [Planctomycetes bacterium]|nr:VCBS repeat-containing protein [Planctomycetota bacterium]
MHLPLSFSTLLWSTCFSFSLLAQTQLQELGKLDQVPADSDQSLRVRAADLDRDGKPDFVVLSLHGIRVYRGDGQGNFQEHLPSQRPLPLAAFGDLEIADIDGDGDLDILYFLHSGPGTRTGIHALFNDGRGNLGPSSIIAQVDKPSCLATGDVDGDGDPDLFVGAGTAGAAGKGFANQLLLNNGKGSFSPSRTQAFPVDTDNTTSAAFGDFDGDGDLDLLIGNSPVYLGPGPQDKLYLGNGKGGFKLVPGGLPRANTATNAIATGDWDGDGDLDFGIASSIGNPILLFQNQGKGTFLLLPPPTSKGLGTDLVLRDLDGDGKLDLALARMPGTSRTDGGMALFFGNGQGRFLPGGKGVTDLQARATSIAVADLDQDGKQDLLMSVFGERNRLFLGLGSREWLDGTRPFRFGSADASTVWNQFEMADLDGDGDLDLLEGGASLRLLLNEGVQGFREVSSTHLPKLSGKVRGFQVVDIDQDGRLDILVGLQSTLTSTLRLLRGMGGGKFAAAPRADLPFTKVFLGIQTGDIDRNGTIDLVVGSYGGPYIFLGDGKGKFRLDTRSSFKTNFGLNPSLLGDLDGDGDLDILAKVGNHAPTNRYQIYLNDGKGVFAFSKTLVVPLSTAQETQLLDIDGDGDLDLVISGNLSILLLNDGKGNFRDVSSTHFKLPWSRYATYQHRFGDWDGDGDLDLVHIQFGGNLAPSTFRYFENRKGIFVEASRRVLGQSKFLVASLSAFSRVVDFDQDGDPDLVFGDSAGKRVLRSLRRHSHFSNALRLGRPGHLELWSRGTGISQTQFAIVQFSAPTTRSWKLPPFGTLQLDLRTLLLLPVLAIPPGGHLRLVLPPSQDTSLLGKQIFSQSLLLGPLGTRFAQWRYTNRTSSTAIGR